MLVSLALALALSAPVTESSPPQPAAAPPSATAQPAAAIEAPATAVPAAQPPAAPPPPTQAPAVIPPAPAPPVPARATVPGVVTPAVGPPAAPPRRTPSPPAHWFHLSLGLGGATAGGSAEQGLAMSEVTGGQVDVLLETGFRFAERFYTDLYLEIGAGDPAGAAAQTCSASCASTRGAIGLEAKYAFAPRRRFNPWIGIGAGFEGTTVTGDVRSGVGSGVRAADWHWHDGSSSSSSSSSTTTIVSYSGTVLPRLSAGLDWRLNRIIGVGLFANLSFARYSTAESDLLVGTARAPLGKYSVSGGTHTWFVLGARAILFP